MQTSEVRINIPCIDYLDHVAKISPLKYRMNENIVKIYNGKPEVQCVVVGKNSLTTARCTVVYDNQEIKMIKRWSLPNGSFEWFSAMDVVTLKRVNIQVTHCVRIEIDAYLDTTPTTTIIWKLGKDDEYQEERVKSLIQKLAQDKLVSYSEAIDILKQSDVWRKRS